MEQSLKPPVDLAVFESHAGTVADLLKALANRRRLMVMCRLAEHGELTVGALAEKVGLSQPALSQHLARMRGEGLVAYRRESQALWYRIADPRCERLLATLYDIYCKDTDR